MNQNTDGGRLSQSTTVVGDISMVTNTSNPVPLNAMDQAKEGKVALDAGDYDRAVELYTLAINNKPEAVDYYIQRSIAYTRLKQNPDHHAALKDAETAVLLAYKREKKELIMKAQLRRVIALASLNRLGDADFLLKILRKMHGPRDYRNNKKDDPMLDAWETRVEVKMAKLNPDDEQLEVTVKEKPEQQVEHAMAMTSLDNAEKEAAEKAKVKEEKGKAGVTQAVKDIRHDYYQSSDMINITIYARFVQERDVVSTIKEDYVSPPHSHN
jgi:suppressor of G2 allele of SKP1